MLFAVWPLLQHHPIIDSEFGLIALAVRLSQAIRLKINLIILLYLIVFNFRVIVIKIKNFMITKISFSQKHFYYYGIIQVNVKAIV